MKFRQHLDDLRGRSWGAVLAVACALMATFALATATTVWRMAEGDDFVQARRTTSLAEAGTMRRGTGLDSWAAMFAAFYRQHNGDAMYHDTLVLDSCKYQYPPSSLLLLEPLPPVDAEPFDCDQESAVFQRVVDGSWAPKPWFDAAARVATIGIAPVSVLLLLALLRAGRPDAPRPGAAKTGVLMLLALTAGLSFYPIVWGYSLGQIQVFLNLLIALALLAHVTGRQALAGALIGLCCLFKPQYCVLLIWVLWRRQWRFGAAMVSVGLVGLVAGVLMYGLQPHLDYVQFLRGLARHGESYWANQSVGGLLHRWMHPPSGLFWADYKFAPDGPLREEPGIPWNAAGFPPYRPLIYWSTLASSLTILALACVPPRGKREALDRGHALAPTLDLAVFIAASTMASPIAWHHHYGVFFPLFAVALAALLLNPPRSRWPWLALLAAYGLMSFAIIRPELILVGPLPGLLTSNAFFGAVIFFGLLLRLRAVATATAQSRLAH